MCPTIGCFPKRRGSRHLILVCVRQRYIRELIAVFLPGLSWSFLGTYTALLTCGGGVDWLVTKLIPARGASLSSGGEVQERYLRRRRVSSRGRRDQGGRHIT